MSEQTDTWASTDRGERFLAPDGCVGFHATLPSLAARALAEGLDFRSFPGRNEPLPGQAAGNFLWQELAQARAWIAEREAEDGGRYQLLALDLAGLALERDPAIAAGSWFTREPIAATRIHAIA